MITASPWGIEARRSVTKAEAGVMQSVPQTKDAWSLGDGKSKADFPHSLLRQ